MGDLHLAVELCTSCEVKHIMKERFFNLWHDNTNGNQHFSCVFADKDREYRTDHDRNNVWQQNTNSHSWEVVLVICPEFHDSSEVFFFAVAAVNNKVMVAKAQAQATAGQGAPCLAGAFDVPECADDYDQ